MAVARWLRRSYRRSVSWGYCIPVFATLIIIKTLLGPSYYQPPPHYTALEQRCLDPTPGCANPFGEKVFISISLYDGGGELAGGRWGEALLELIYLIGPRNVFLSIYESDSGEDGAKALQKLRRRLTCRHAVVSEPQLSVEHMSTVDLPDGTSRLKRIAYLAETRNLALQPLDTFSDGDVEYDKILFMNDVVYRPIDAAQLLFSTNVGPDGRSRYLAACALDYLQPFIYYDTFATRDLEGFSVGLPLFPIFTSSGRGESRAALLGVQDAVPVSSCWGGLVAMEARHVQNLNSSEQVTRSIIDPANPTNVTAPVRFRYEPEPFLEACECCLFLADVTQVAKRASTTALENVGTYINPYVRVAYSSSTLIWAQWLRRWERVLSIPQAILSPLVHLPRYNPYRVVQEGEDFTEEVWVADADGGHWELVKRKGRSGLICSIRAMLVMKTRQHTKDKNWEDFPLPPDRQLFM